MKRALLGVLTSLSLLLTLFFAPQSFVHAETPLGTPPDNTYCFANTDHFICYDKLEDCKVNKPELGTGSDSCTLKSLIKSSPEYHGQLFIYAPVGVPPDDDKLFCYVSGLVIGLTEGYGFRQVCAETMEKCNAELVANGDVWRDGECGPWASHLWDIKNWCYGTPPSAASGPDKYSTYCYPTHDSCIAYERIDGRSEHACAYGIDTDWSYIPPILLGGGTSTPYKPPPAWTPSGSCTPLVPCDGTTNNCDFAALVWMIKCIIQFLIIDVAVPVAGIMFVYAGFVYMTSGGNPGKARLAKNVFVAVVGGLVLMLIAWLIVDAILQGLGVKDAFNFLNDLVLVLFH